MRSGVTQARPTIYRGTQMRSRTEAKAAAAYDRAGLTWLYEPLCYANAQAQYLPDFVIADRVTVVGSMIVDYWAGQSFWEIKWRHDEAEDALSRMAVIWDGSVKAPLIGWVPDSRRAWAALPSTANADDTADGLMFEADVMQCDVHGVVVQSTMLSQLRLGDNACQPCNLEEIVGTVCMVAASDPSAPVVVEFEAFVRNLREGRDRIVALHRRLAANHAKLTRQAEKLRTRVAELGRSDVVPDPAPLSATWQNNPIARRWLRHVCAP